MQLQSLFRKLTEVERENYPFNLSFFCFPFGFVIFISKADFSLFRLTLIASPYFIWALIISSDNESSKYF